MSLSMRVRQLASDCTEEVPGAMTIEMSAEAPQLDATAFKRLNLHKVVGDFCAVADKAYANPGVRYRRVIMPEDSDDPPDDASCVKAEFSKQGCQNSNLLHYLFRFDIPIGMEVSFGYITKEIMVGGVEKEVLMMVVYFMVPRPRALRIKK